MVSELASPEARAVRQSATRHAVKAEVDAFRRMLEGLIAAGGYRPACEPGQWWVLWAEIEDSLGIRGV